MIAVKNNSEVNLITFTPDSLLKKKTLPHLLGTVMWVLINTAVIGPHFLYPQSSYLPLLLFYSTTTCPSATAVKYLRAQLGFCYFLDIHVPVNGLAVLTHSELEPFKNFHGS